MLIWIRGAEELLLISIPIRCMGQISIPTEIAGDLLPSVPPKALQTSYQSVCIRC